MRLWRYLWAFPATAVGLSMVALAWLTGGRTRCVDGVLEVHGGLVTTFLRRGFFGFRPATARACGHVIIGCDADTLDNCRTHERVHVRQCERWGPLFMFLYCGSSLLAWWRGRDPYYDNVFEKEACDAEKC